MSAPPIESLRDLRRSQIVTQARRLVAERGLEGLTFGALEEQLAFTRGVITYHFRNKEEIVDAVLTSAVDEINGRTLAATRGGDTVEEKIQAMIEATARGFLDNLEATSILLSFWSRIRTDPAIHERNAELYAGFRAKTRSLLEAARDQGKLDPAVDLDALAAHLVGVVIGIVTQVYFEPDAIAVDKAVEIAARAVLRGVLIR